MRTLVIILALVGVGVGQAHASVASCEKSPDGAPCTEGCMVGACHAGSCAATGPAATGTACASGDPCTTDDACNGQGVCSPGPRVEDSPMCPATVPEPSGQTPTSTYVPDPGAYEGGAMGCTLATGSRPNSAGMLLVLFAVPLLRRKRVPNRGN